MLEKLESRVPIDGSLLALGSRQLTFHHNILFLLWGTEVWSVQFLSSSSSLYIYIYILDDKIASVFFLI